MSRKPAPEVGASLREGLDLVGTRGAPVQQAEASRLAAVLADAPDDAEAATAARHLIDAYLHDPYLERG